jgi:hypothetical protein
LRLTKEISENIRSFFLSSESLNHTSNLKEALLNDEMGNAFISKMAMIIFKEALSIH